ncbi:MAG: hypothetical protein HY700_09410 [Gemmatimonadetes bacterium]|nr:hypothetical protein [Gemmatimonadota bacterium]
MSPRKALLFLLALAGSGVGSTRAQSPAAVTIEPVIGGSRDSDGDALFRFGVGVDGPASARSRLGVVATRGQVADGIDRVRLMELLARGSWQLPGRTTINAGLGGSALDLSGTAATERVIPTGYLRVRARGASGTSLDARAQRVVVDGSPTLVAARVVREEVGTIFELPVAGALHARALGRLTGISSRFDRNTRAQVAGMVVFKATPEVEISGQLHRITYAHSSTAGYFAPRLIEIAQLGSYTELERNRTSFALDVSLGAQRLAPQGGIPGTWRRAYGIWSLVSYAMSRRTALRLELEAYDAPAAGIVTSGSGWRYGSASVSLRWKVG